VSVTVVVAEPHDDGISARMCMLRYNLHKLETSLFVARKIYKLHIFHFTVLNNRLYSK